MTREGNGANGPGSHAGSSEFFRLYNTVITLPPSPSPLAATNCHASISQNTGGNSTSAGPSEVSSSLKQCFQPKLNCSLTSDTAGAKNLKLECVSETSGELHPSSDVQPKILYLYQA